MGNSEFVLTIFGALVQEESANTSKRVLCEGFVCGVVKLEE